MEYKEANIDFYKNHYQTLTQAQAVTINILSSLCDDKIEYIKTRIKSKNSTINKLLKLGLSPTVEDSLENLTDLVGIRFVCNFLSDVFEVATIIENCPHLTHILSKDYITHPKPNGYRSYHIIVSTLVGVTEVPVEIQLRSISQDSWACLEHQIKYKKDLQEAELITQELKRIADEMASTDLCMQTIRDLIQEKHIK